MTYLITCVQVGDDNIKGADLSISGLIGGCVGHLSGPSSESTAWGVIAVKTDLSRVICGSWHIPRHNDTRLTSWDRSGHSRGTATDDWACDVCWYKYISYQAQKWIPL